MGGPPGIAWDFLQQNITPVSCRRLCVLVSAPRVEGQASKKEAGVKVEILGQKTFI